MAKNKQSRDHRAENERRSRRGYFEEYHRQRRETVHGVAYRLVQDARRRAQRKEIAFEIDIDWLRERIKAQNSRCAVTGIEFEFVADARSPWRPSIDRIDSNEGYTPENTQVVVLMYNDCKNAGSHDDVMRFSRAILGFGS